MFSSNLSKESLIESIGEDRIWKYYIPELKKLPCTIKSPLREEHKPSFFMYRHRNGHIYYIDRATGEKGGLIDFIMTKYRVSSINDALVIINNEFNFGIKIESKKKPFRIKEVKKEISINITKRDWSLYDYEYWASYGCIKNKSFKFLESMGVIPISEIEIKNDDYVKIIQPNTISYSYECNTEYGLKRKIYTPFSSNYKWLSNLPKGYIDFKDIALNIPKRKEILIITSSRKDCLCLMNNLNINAISPSSETVKMDLNLINELKKRYRNILVLFDNDFGKDVNTGVLNGKKLSEEFGLTYVELPEEWEAKDPSDLYRKLRNKTKFIKRIKELIKNRII